MRPIAACFACLALLSACEPNERAAAAPAPQPRPAAAAEGLVDPPPPSSAPVRAPGWSYDASERRNPFETYAQARGEPEVIRDFALLSDYDLDQLKLVGVVVGTASPTALVEDPTGRGHALKVGAVVSKRMALVKAIGRDRVVFETTLRDGIDRVVREPFEMRIEARKL